MEELVQTKQWYVLKVFTGKEEKVKSYIMQQAQREGLSERIEEIFIPTETVIEIREGKKREKQKILFPGYLFIKMSIESDVRYFLVNLPNVIGFADNTQDPEPLQAQELDRLFGRKERGDRVSVDVLFHVDDVVKISEGPFKDWVGSIREINQEKRKLKVLVSLFGRSTPVEVDFLHVTTHIEK